jgi:hypothetical protein
MSKRTFVRNKQRSGIRDVNRPGLNTIRESDVSSVESFPSVSSNSISSFSSGPTKYDSFETPPPSRGVTFDDLHNTTLMSLNAAAKNRFSKQNDLMSNFKKLAQQKKTTPSQNPFNFTRKDTTSTRSNVLSRLDSPYFTPPITPSRFTPISSSKTPFVPRQTPINPKPEGLSPAPINLKPEGLPPTPVLDMRVRTPEGYIPYNKMSREQINAYFNPSNFQFKIPTPSETLAKPVPRRVLNASENQLNKYKVQINADTGVKPDVYKWAKPKPEDYKKAEQAGPWKDPTPDIKLNPNKGDYIKQLQSIAPLKKTAIKGLYPVNQELNARLREKTTPATKGQSKFDTSHPSRFRRIVDSVNRGAWRFKNAIGNKWGQFKSYIRNKVWNIAVKGAWRGARAFTGLGMKKVKRISKRKHFK